MLFWEKYSKGRLCNLKNFRDTKKNNIFASWSPYDKGLPYYNFQIFQFVLKYKKKFISFKKKNNRTIGNPPSINFDNKYNICFDDCLTFEEIFFLQKNFNNKKNLNIMEIGAGFGRTAEGIINNLKIKNYTIVDYKNILKFAKNYLKKILSSKKFKKIKFLDYEKINFDNYFDRSNNFDLIINIDSFAEIEPVIVKKYLNFIKKKSDYFYTKNPVDKYRFKDMVNHLSKKKTPNFIKKLGLNRKIINIFDTKQLEESKKKFLINYNPYKTIKKNKPKTMYSALFNYYIHALFKKN